MRRLYEQLGGALRGFIDQRDDLLLLVAASDADAPLILQSLREFDHSSPGDLVLLFGDAFVTPGPYLDALAAQLREEIALANSVAGPGDTPLPPAPDALFEAAVPPPTRLQFGLDYAAARVDPRGGQRYVWGMVPSEIRAAEAYLKLLAGLPAAEPSGWMRGGRVIARVPANFALARSPLASAPRVRVERLVIPHDAHERELNATWSDPAVPEADRMAAAVQLGFIDAAHDRLPAATEHFRKSLAFFQWVRIPAMTGLVMMGLGDVARRGGDAAGARRWFESALVPAVESDNPVLLASIVQNLAAVAYNETKYDEAADRYAALVGLRRSTFDEDGTAEALEWEGNALEKAGRQQDAVFRWYEAALIGRTFQLEHRLATVLPRLRGGYERLQWKEAVETFDETWKARGVGV